MATPHSTREEQGLVTSFTAVCCTATLYCAGPITASAVGILLAFPPLVYDWLQYAKTEGEYVGHFIMMLLYT